MQLATRDNDTTVAKKVGLSPSTIGRWRSGEIDPKPRQVVAFARVYGKSPLAALVAAEYLTAQDLDGDLPIGATHDLDEVSTNALLDELNARLESMSDYIGWLKAIGSGVGSPANLAASSLRDIDPASPPAETDGSVFIEAIKEHLKVSATIEGTPVYGLRNEYSVDQWPPHLREELAALAERVPSEPEGDVSGSDENAPTGRQSDYARAAKERSKNRGEEYYD